MVEVEEPAVAEAWLVLGWRGGGAWEVIRVLSYFCITPHGPMDHLWKVACEVLPVIFLHYPTRPDGSLVDGRLRGPSGAVGCSHCPTRPDSSLVEGVGSTRIVFCIICDGNFYMFGAPPTENV